MSATAPVVDKTEQTHRIEHLDFKVPCTWISAEKVPCRTPADWQATCRSCGTAWFICDPHLTVLRGRDVEVLGDVWGCKDCGRTGPRLDHVMAFEPFLQ